MTYGRRIFHSVFHQVHQRNIFSDGRCIDDRACFCAVVPPEPCRKCFSDYSGARRPCLQLCPKFFQKQVIVVQWRTGGVHAGASLCIRKFPIDRHAIKLHSVHIVAGDRIHRVDVCIVFCRIGYQCLKGACRRPVFSPEVKKQFHSVCITRISHYLNMIFPAIGLAHHPGVPVNVVLNELLPGVAGGKYGTVFTLGVMPELAPPNNTKCVMAL